MSQKNPNVNEILEKTTGQIGKHLCRSYLNLAKARFYKENDRRSTLDDAQALRDIYEDMWVDYYIHRDERYRFERKISEPIWAFGCSIHIDVKHSMIYFLRERPGFDFKESIKESNYGTYIMANNLFGEWKQYAIDNLDKLKYVKRSFIDFGHLAYNGVTEDF